MADQSSEYRPLYIWPKGANLDDMKKAVVEAELPFAVRPFWYDPRHRGPAICLEDGFPWVYDHIRPKSHAARVAAVKWFFGLRDLPQGPRLLFDNMKDILGDIVEVEDDGGEDTWE